MLLRYHDVFWLWTFCCGYYSCDRCWLLTLDVNALCCCCWLLTFPGLLTCCCDVDLTWFVGCFVVTVAPFVDVYVTFPRWLRCPDPFVAVDVTVSFTICCPLFFYWLLLLLLILLLLLRWHCWVVDCGYVALFIRCCTLLLLISFTFVTRCCCCCTICYVLLLRCYWTLPFPHCVYTRYPWHHVYCCPTFRCSLLHCCCYVIVTFCFAYVWFYSRLLFGCCHLPVGWLRLFIVTRWRLLLLLFHLPRLLLFQPVTYCCTLTLLFVAVVFAVVRCSLLPIVVVVGCWDCCCAVVGWYRYCLRLRYVTYGSVPVTVVVIWLHVVVTVDYVWLLLRYGWLLVDPVVTVRYLPVALILRLLRYVVWLRLRCLDPDTFVDVCCCFTFPDFTFTFVDLPVAPFTDLLLLFTLRLLNVRCWFTLLFDLRGCLRYGDYVVIWLLRCCCCHDPLLFRFKRCCVILIWFGLRCTDDVVAVYRFTDCGVPVVPRYVGCWHTLDRCCCVIRCCCWFADVTCCWFVTLLTVYVTPLNIVIWFVTLLRFTYVVYCWLRVAFTHTVVDCTLCCCCCWWRCSWRYVWRPLVYCDAFDLRVTCCLFGCFGWTLRYGCLRYCCSRCWLRYRCCVVVVVVVVTLRCRFILLRCVVCTLLPTRWTFTIVTLLLCTFALLFVVVDVGLRYFVVVLLLLIVDCWLFCCCCYDCCFALLLLRVVRCARPFAARCLRCCLRYGCGCPRALLLIVVTSPLLI